MIDGALLLDAISDGEYDKATGMLLGILAGILVGALALAVAPAALGAVGAAVLSGLAAGIASSLATLWWDSLPESIRDMFSLAQLFSSAAIR